MEDTNNTRIKILEIELDHVKEDIKSLTKQFEDYVTNSKFEPVKLIVYGLTGLILTAVGTTLVSTVVRLA